MELKIGGVPFSIKKDGYSRDAQRLNTTEVENIRGQVQPSHTRFTITENISISDVDNATANMLMGLASGKGHVFECQETPFSSTGTVPLPSSTYSQQTEPHYFQGTKTYQFTDTQWAVDSMPSRDWTLLAITSDDGGANFHTSVTTSTGRYWYDGVEVVASVLTWDVVDTRLVVQETDHTFSELVFLPYIVTDRLVMDYAEMNQPFHPLPKLNVTVGHTTQVSHLAVSSNNLRASNCNTHVIELILTTQHDAHISTTPMPLACLSLDPSSNRASHPSTDYLACSVSDYYATLETVGNFYQRGPGGSLMAPYMPVNARTLTLPGFGLLDYLQDNKSLHISGWVECNVAGALDNQIIFQFGTATDHLALYVNSGILVLRRQTTNGVELVTGVVPYNEWFMFNAGFQTEKHTDTGTTSDMYLYANAKLLQDKTIPAIMNVPVPTDVSNQFEAFDSNNQFDGHGQNLNFYRTKPTQSAMESLYQLGLVGELI